jgi:hypothetical protein
MKNSTGNFHQILFTGLIFSAFLLFQPLSGYSENEPNNSLETANVLALDGNISGSFSAADNSSDYFKLTTTVDGKLTVTVTADAGLCVSLYFLSETGLYTLYNNGSCGTGNYSNTITVNNLAAGLYFLEATNSGYGNYSISNTFVPASLSNDTEPNDEVLTALTIAPNSSKIGHLGFRKVNTDYYDYYKLTTTTDGKLTIDIAPDPTLCVDLTVNNESGSMNLYSNGYCSNPSHTNSLVINNLAAGTYSIAASAIGYGSYTLSNSLVPASLVNDAEPNNSRETAISLSPSAEVAGHLGYRYIQTDDYDYYKIVTTGNLNLTFNVSSDPELCVNMTLLNSTGGMNLLTNGYCGNANHTDSMVKNALAAGTYYLEVGGVGYGSYRVKTSFSFVSGLDKLDVPSENMLTIFPNPSKNEIVISLSKVSNPEIKIYDIKGTNHIPNRIEMTEKLCKVDVSNFNSGMYFVELKQDNQVFRTKFIKE